jgi:glycosyltransferase involved in cell wall biosynthesis
VVIPLYNKGKYIERALSSVLAQTFPPLEIIVVDDGSTDDGPERVLKFNDPRITLIRQENKGPGAARNAGLSRAKGKYVSFLDADDEWMPSFLEAGLSILEDDKANATVVCTGRIKYPENKRNIFGGSDGVYEITAETDMKLVLKIFQFRSSPSFMIMRTDVVKKWGGFFDRYKCLSGEDMHLSLKLLFNERIGVITSPHAIYHTEASQLSCKRKTHMPPFLVDPNEVLLFCHPSKRHLLQQLLCFLVTNKVIELAKLGKKKEAEELFYCFSRHVHLSTKNKFKVYTFIGFSPILPIVRRFCRLLNP